jgi:3-oxoacyl-[acyl-carrier-protein] synthase II
MKNRVVITGMGAVTPIGNDVNNFWNNIKEGTCGIDIIKSFDISEFKCKLGAEVKDFDVTVALDKREARKMDKYCQYAMVAADEAIKNSGLDLQAIDSERLAVVVGSGIGGLNTIEQEHKKLMEKGPNRVSPFLIPMIIGNIAAGSIAIKYQAKVSVLV